MRRVVVNFNVCKTSYLIGELSPSGVIAGAKYGSTKNFQYKPMQKSADIIWYVLEPTLPHRTTCWLLALHTHVAPMPYLLLKLPQALRQTVNNCMLTSVSGGNWSWTHSQLIATYVESCMRLFVGSRMHRGVHFQISALFHIIAGIVSQQTFSFAHWYAEQKLAGKREKVGQSNCLITEVM